ncbi:MAG TPA: methylenetetrahydrofolate reductase [Tepiditoga sp.]|nr:methylenetetrahydrofolate reductase [Tepiditoga sp.]
MKITEKFGKKPLISFEIFPPKKTGDIKTVYRTIDELACLNPDYISVTYGATGSSAGSISFEISSAIQNKYKIDSLAHITSINTKKSDMQSIAEKLISENIENVLALRGDSAPENIKNDFTYASDLVDYFRKNYNFCIGAAGYPEGHIESRNKSLDLYYLEKKVKTGVDFLITQLFFDNSFFYDFYGKLKNRNINIPVQAGIMPVTNKNQIEKITSLCGSFIPEKFIKIMTKYENNKEALTDAGIAYATDQIIDLISSGVSGIHLYVMNKPYVAKKIVKNISSVLNYFDEKNL